jgi:hypothetical protein
MAASVMITGNTVSIGNPRGCFCLPADAGGSGSSWTVTSDHTRFIAVDDPHGGTGCPRPHQLAGK